MSSVALLMLGHVLPQTLFGVAWLLGGWFLGISRAVAAHGLGITLVGVPSMLLFVRQGTLPDWLTYHFASGLCLLCFLLARRAHQVFHGRPRTDREQALVLLLFAGTALLYPDMQGDATVRRVVISLLQAWTCARTLAESVPAARREFGPRVAAALGCVLGGAVLLSGTRVLLILLRMDTPAAEAFFIIALVPTLMLQQLVLGCLVVARQVRHLAHLSQHDALTGLPNRRALEERLAAECARLRRGGEPFALLLLDLDHFKRLNDTHGHAVGDAALRRAARLMLGGVRDGDLVARLGGEEFCVLLPGVCAAEAAAIAERLRARLAALPGAGEEALAVTISMGVALARGCPPVAPEGLLRSADAALYEAKKAGRNRVVLASGDPERAGPPWPPAQEQATA